MSSGHRQIHQHQREASLLLDHLQRFVPVLGEFGIAVREFGELGEDHFLVDAIIFHHKNPWS